MPRGLDTLGLVVPGVLVLPVVLPPLSEALDEFGGPHGFGRGSRFSVRDGWAPDSELPPRAEKGLLPNYGDRHQKIIKTQQYFNCIRDKGRGMCEYKLQRGAQLNKK